MSWAFQRESELLPIFNYWISKMHQTGVIDRQQQKSIGGLKWATDTSISKDNNGLDYKNVAFPFIALLTGLFVAFIQLGIEASIMCKRKCSNDEEQAREDEDSSSEEAKDAIEEIYDLLLKNHCKVKKLKFLSKMRVLSGKPL